MLFFICVVRVGKKNSSVTEKETDSTLKTILLRFVFVWCMLFYQLAQVHDTMSISCVDE